MEPILDFLTPLYSRNYMMALGKTLCEQALTNGSLLGLVYADIDRMRSVNNILGFQAGDRLIVRFAQAILSHLREGDVAGRIGGDEFMILVPAKSEEEIEALAEAIREEVKTIIVMGGSHNEVPSETMTLGLGLSCLPRHGTDLRSLIIAANEATILAKERGGDRLVWANMTQVSL